VNRRIALERSGSRRTTETRLKDDAMLRFYNPFAWLMLAAAISGCRSYQLRNDQDKMRQALLDLYTNQLMDNLVRAHNGLPFVQLDYTNMTGTVTQDASGSFNQDQTLANNRSAVAATVRNFTNVVRVGLSSSERMQLTITGSPVLNNNEVYNAYLEFLGKPERFVVTSEPPPPGAAHIVRCSTLGCCEGGKRYYWVPCEFRYDFLRLALVTTVQRGQPLSTPDFFENTITRVEDALEPKGYTILYLKKHIPNDRGKLTVTLGDEIYELGFEMWPQATKIKGEEFKRGTKIDRLLLEIPVDKKTGQVFRKQGQEDIPGRLMLPEFKKAIEGKNVRIDLTYFRPTLPTSEDLLQAIRHEVGLIRLEQVGR